MEENEKHCFRFFKIPSSTRQRVRRRTLRRKWGLEYLPRELLEEIETNISPYIRRMWECDYLSPSEIREFMESCYMQVEDLRNQLGEMEAKQLSAKGG